MTRAGKAFQGLIRSLLNLDVAREAETLEKLSDFYKKNFISQMYSSDDNTSHPQIELEIHLISPIYGALGNVIL